MEINNAGFNKYKEMFPAPYHQFNSADFNLLNESRCEKVLFLIFKDTKPRLGLIAGIQGNELHSPFSAPFGGFSFLNDDITIAQLESGVDALILFAAEEGYESIHYTMPPLFYNETFISKLTNVLHRKKFSITVVDLNYQFNLQKLDQAYEMNIWYNARKNLKISLRQDFDFIKCESTDSKLEAYEVIKENRRRKGFPLKMTYDQVIQTTEIIKADFFLLKKEANKVAAAQVFHVAPGIVQVIYWGDIPDFASFKPMNFLAYSIFKYYKEQGFNYVDIGPSTENGIPNYGLCEFKESIGCDITAKFSFIKSIEA
jgi:hypothetical protein